MVDIEIRDEGSLVLCRPVGELDAHSVPVFRQVLVSMAHTPRLVIDLSAVPFMDSSGLGALIGAIRRIREADGEVAVACSRPTLTQLLHITGFDRIVPVTETVAAACVALTVRPGGDDLLG